MRNIFLLIIIILLLYIIYITNIYENFYQDVNCYDKATGFLKQCCYCFTGTPSDDSLCVNTAEHCSSCNTGYTLNNNRCLLSGEVEVVEEQQAVVEEEQEVVEEEEVVVEEQQEVVEEQQEVVEEEEEVVEEVVEEEEEEEEVVEEVVEEEEEVICETGLYKDTITGTCVECMQSCPVGQYRVKGTCSGDSDYQCLDYSDNCPGADYRRDSGHNGDCIKCKQWGWLGRTYMHRHDDAPDDVEC